MSPEHDNNKAAVRRFHDAANTGDLQQIASAIDELVAPDAVIRTASPIAATGPQGLKDVFARLLHAYPDLHVAIEDLIAEGDKVASRNAVTGTHLGEYMGHPASGKRIAYNEMFIFRFADGQIAETWGVVDVLSQLAQIGVLPAATRKAPTAATRAVAGELAGRS